MNIEVIELFSSGEAKSKILELLSNKEQSIATDGIITPIFEGGEPYFVMRNSELFAQCIDAKAQAACGYNYSLMLDDKEAPITDDAKRTIDMIENINPNMPFIEVLKRNVYDLELFGYSGVEVLLSKDMTEFELMNVPVHELRLCRKDADYTSIKVNERNRLWKFRRYAQVCNADKVFFKELFDPRIIDYETGQVTNDTKKAANPLLWMDNGLHTDREYPNVLWESVGYSAMAISSVNELNYKYFKNGRIQTQVLLVNGGDMQKGEVEKMMEDFKTTKGGVNTAGSLIVIQSAPKAIEVSGGTEEKISPVKMELLPLTPLQGQDPQYLEFLNDCRRAVMSAFRVPPIVLGLSFDYNRATSEEATETFYTKVILPLQQKLENAYNKLLAFTGNKYRIRLNNPYRDGKRKEEEEEEKL